VFSKHFFKVKILKFFDADPGSGMEKIRIRDGKNTESGINIPDTQHWCKEFILFTSVFGYRSKLDLDSTGSVV
jgi:hypothetical protein